MRLDFDAWEETQHNPVLMLGKIKQEKLDELANDGAFLAQLERAVARFDAYQDKSASWFHKTHPNATQSCFAYFSAEFGLTECLQNYSGGLGVLSGDHLKAASDLGLPLVGAGLLYQQGYFHQYLNADGWQQERYPDNDFYALPLQLEKDSAGNPITVFVDLPGEKCLHKSGACKLGAFRYTCSTPIFRKTTMKIKILPINYMAVIPKCASSRKFYSASAATAH